MLGVTGQKRGDSFCIVMKREPLMVIRDLKKYYPVRGSTIGKKKPIIHAVDGVDFEIYEGETLGIVGESGCGKSTIGRQIVALEKPTSGHVLYQGESLSDMSAGRLRKIRTHLQMVFQDSTSSLNPRKQIYDILAAPILYHKIVERDMLDEEINRLLDLVGLPKSMKYRYPRVFGRTKAKNRNSQGSILRPRLVVCDER